MMVRNPAQKEVDEFQRIKRRKKQQLQTSTHSGRTWSRIGDLQYLLCRLDRHDKATAAGAGAGAGATVQPCITSGC